MTVEKTYVNEVVENASDSEAHDMRVELNWKIKQSMHVYQEILMLPLDNFVGQLGGIIGLYIGWSFVSVATYMYTKLVSCLGTESNYTITRV